MARGCLLTGDERIADRIGRRWTSFVDRTRGTAPGEISSLSWKIGKIATIASIRKDGRAS